MHCKIGKARMYADRKGIYMSSPISTFKYTSLCVDEGGESSFHDEEATLEDQQYTKSAPPISMAALNVATRVAILKLPKGLVGNELHAAPRHQWVFVTSGTIEIEASSGECRTFSTGAVLTVRDAGRIGHKTRPVS